MVRVDAQRNRAIIIDAARDLFKEVGLDAPMDEIARRAGVGSGTLYRHFPSREDLHSAVMHSWIAVASERARMAVQREGSKAERLLWWLKDYVDLITTHRGSALVLTAHLGDDASPFRDKCDAYIDAMDAVLTELEIGFVPRVRAEVVAVCRVVGGVAAVSDEGSLDDNATTSLLELVVAGLRGAVEVSDGNAVGSR